MAPTENKRKYIKDPAEKVNAGIPWFFHLELDEDNARNILAEKDGLEYGGEFKDIINARIRQAYAKKKVVRKKKKK